MSINDDRPQIFMCFAGEDRPAAQRMATDLTDCGVRPFVDATSIGAGENILIAIDRAISQSDYFVLLWSRHTRDRDWVELEWTAALTRELDERRSFLFVVRLDNSPMPTLLAPRKYLDAMYRWDDVVVDLATVWNRDRSQGMPVLPAPNPPEPDNAFPQPSRPGGPPIVLYVRNQRIPVAHVVPVSATATGAQLRSRVSEALGLPDSAPNPNQLLTTRITYELEFAGRPIADRPLAEQGVTDHRTIDLVVTVEDVANGGDVLSAPRTYRQGSRVIVSEQAWPPFVEAVLDHLRPWQPGTMPIRRSGGVPGW